MNKFFEIREGSIQEDLKFIKSLNVDNKKLDESQLWTKLCMHSKAHHVDHEKRIDEKKRFSSHPKRLFSDTDTSVGANSPGRVALSSSDSNLHLDHKETFVYEFYQENKMEMKNTRKKLHKKLTQTKEDNAYHFEVGIGDSSSVSPRSNRDKRSVVFEDEKCQKTEPIKPSRAKPKHKSVVTVPSKKLLPSKASSSHHAQKPLVTDSVFERKFKTFVEKSLHTINDIRALLEIGIGPPDGDEDMSRRITRVKEFSNRFSRNCLYPLARQLNDLSGMSPEDVNVNQRLLSSYQTILNGLQAYLTHLPTSFGSCATDKLKTLLKHLLELCGIHTKLFRLPDENGCLDFINTFKLNAELTLKKIEEHYNAISTHSMLKSANTTKVSLQRGGASKATLKNNGPNKNKIERRLSMYSMSACFRRDANWKKAVESLAKQKLNVKSRYKTSTFRHRPPLVKEPPILPIPSKFKLFCKKSSDMLRRTPVTTPVNEDTITTMVEMESEKDKLGRKEEDAKTPLNHEEVVVKLLQLVLDNNRRMSRAGDEGDEPRGADAQIADILERLRTEGDAETLQKIVDGLRGSRGGDEGNEERADEAPQLQLRIVCSGSSAEEAAAKKKRKEPIVTITGEKNAKLICIKDENSIVETDGNDDAEPGNRLCQTEEGSGKGDVKSKEKTHKAAHKSARGPSIRMNRLPRPTRVLQMLPKTYAVNVIQYKLDFHNSCKTNPMYRRTTDVEPWMLMGRISDDILDFALLGVAREIEVNDIVQKIYESELQL